jgi:hypothetical protein
VEGHKSFAGSPSFLKRRFGIDDSPFAASHDRDLIIRHFSKGPPIVQTYAASQDWKAKGVKLSWDEI